MFISFEGGEGAGKTTLITRLYETLVHLGEKVCNTRAPGGTKLGDAIRSLLLHNKQVSICPRSELFLFLADRAQHTDEVIIPALQEGKIVLCDRFNDSTVAYQGVGRGFGKEWIYQLSHFATQQREPELTFYLDLSPNIGLSRTQGRVLDRIEKEDLLFHEKIRQAYLSLAKEEPERFYVLDASKTQEEIFAECLSVLQKKNLFLGKGRLCR